MIISDEYSTSRPGQTNDESSVVSISTDISRSSPVTLDPRNLSPASKSRFVSQWLADMADKASLNDVPGREVSAASAGSSPRSLSPPRSVSTRKDLLKSDINLGPTTYSVFSTDNSSCPRSLSPSPSLPSARDQIARAAIERASRMCTENSSFVSTDSPISLTPQGKVSKYAVSMIKAYRNHLSRTLIDSEETHSNEKADISRSDVTSMKYADSNVGLSGNYHGQVDEHSIPDGIGSLCCHDGQLLDGKWEKGQFIGGGKGKSYNGDPMKSVSGVNDKNLLDSVYVYLNCDDTSTCSSLSDSVTSKFFRSDISEFKTQRIPPEVCLDAPLKSVHWVDTHLCFRKSVVRRKYEP